MRKLHMEGNHIDVGQHLPTLADLTYIFPKGAAVPVHELFLAVESFCRGVRSQGVHVVEVEASADVAPAPRVNPWFGRTRSSSALASALLHPSQLGPVEHVPRRRCRRRRRSHRRRARLPARLRRLRQWR